MTCTWEGCEHEGTVPQVGKDGSTWATLCGEHDKKLSDAIAASDPKKMLGCWIKAQGGSQAATARMVPAAQRVAAEVASILKAAREIAKAAKETE